MGLWQRPLLSSLLLLLHVQGSRARGSATTASRVTTEGVRTFKRALRVINSIDSRLIVEQVVNRLMKPLPPSLSSSLPGQEDSMAGK